jgi:hypothetical protein
MAGEEMINMTNESRLAQRSITYNFLNKEGRSELEFILMYLHKKQSLQSAHVLPHLAALLFLYLIPSEVFYVCNKLVT